MIKDPRMTMSYFACIVIADHEGNYRDINFSHQSILSDRHTKRYVQWTWYVLVFSKSF